MPDLRSIWPTLTPRQQDAMVAEALGKKVVWMPPFGALLEPKEPGGYHWEVPPYSTAWEYAGPLLSQLADDGWFPVLEARYSRDRSEIRWFLSGCSGEGRSLPQGDGFTLAPEAIALAFCLAKEGR